MTGITALSLMASGQTEPQQTHGQTKETQETAQTEEKQVHPAQKKQ
jgi:hypothetical protein